ncbi:MAG: ABC transporter ATP-binding protein, partial [Candidatus Bathyarchaeia archaeon]
EFSDTYNILKKYAHPYVESLLKALPECNKRGKQLYVIPGTLPNLLNPPSGCRFHPRCPYKKEVCRKKVPELIEIDSGHYVACHIPLAH